MVTKCYSRCLVVAMIALHSKRSLFIRIVTFFLLPALASGAGAALISYDDTQVATGRVSRAWVVGIVIEVGDDPIIINALGVQDTLNAAVSDDGFLSDAIEVGLWTADGRTLLASASVTSEDILIDSYRYTKIPKLTLETHARYLLAVAVGVGLEGWLDGQEYASSTPFSGSNGITIVENRYAWGGRLRVPMLDGERRIGRWSPGNATYLTAERADNPNPTDKAENVLRHTMLSWEMGSFAATHDVYFGTVFNDVNEADRANPHDMLVSQGQALSVYDPGILDSGQTYYWRVDEVNVAPDNTIFKGEVWSFVVIDHRKQAGRPVPADEDKILSITSPHLYWTPGLDAVAHRVYMGTSALELNLLGEIKVCGEVELSPLTPDCIYYWRVDEVQPDGSVVEGPVWCFNSRVLVAHWKFDETGGREAADASGNKLHGQLNGDPTWRPSGGRVGGALEFDGDGDYVDCGNASAFDLTHEITIAAWIKVHAFNKYYQALVAKGDRGWRLLRKRHTDSLVFACDPPATRLALWGEISVNDGAWHYVAATYDCRALTLYVDGEVDGIRPAIDPILADDQPVFIGENPESPEPTNGWDGMIDDVRIYSRALSQVQIKAIYHGGEIETSGVNTKLPRLIVSNDQADMADWDAGQVPSGVEVPAVESEEPSPAGKSRLYQILKALSDPEK
jgi:hypothetical protein